MHRKGAHIYRKSAYAPFLAKSLVLDGWMDGWMGECKGVKAGLRIAYSNQKIATWTFSEGAGECVLDVIQTKGASFLKILTNFTFFSFTFISIM